MKHALTSTLPMVLLIILAAMVPAGCSTGAQTGALAGGGIGALAGQAIGRDTESTLIGAAVGTGIGYIIGNEKDKDHASQLAAQSTASPPTHHETGSLARTKWKLESLNPSTVTAPYKSKIIEFNQQGRVITTTTRADGHVEYADESYRVVGDTLIINKPGYIINARHVMSNDQLVVNAENFSAVLRRQPS